MEPKFTILLAFLFFVGCAHSRESSKTAEENQHQKVEILSESLSQVQTRLEELDAKLSALSDKLEATRIAVENLNGTKALKTENIGKLKHDEESHDESAKPSSTDEELDLDTAFQAPASKEDAIIHCFQDAMELFKQKKFADAALAFQQFIEANPHHILTGSAQYFVGESYLYLGEFRLAINEYNSVLSTFQDHPRSASATIRIAQAYQLLGDLEQASHYQEMAERTYPGSPALTLSLPENAPSKTGDRRVANDHN